MECLSIRAFTYDTGKLLKERFGLMEREKGYQQLDDVFGHPFPSVRAFCLADPPHGIGFDPAVLDALVRDTRHMTLVEFVGEVETCSLTHKSAT